MSIYGLTSNTGVKLAPSPLLGLLGGRVELDGALVVGDVVAVNLVLLQL